MAIERPEELLLRIVKILNKLEIPYIITGGFACAVLAKPRFTADIDIIVEMTSKNVPQLAKELLLIDKDVYVSQEAMRDAIVGDVLRGHLQITVPRTRNFVIIEDYISAGMELVNLDLATEEKSLRLQEKELKGREFYPDFKEIRDDRVFLFKEDLAPGVYEFDYYARALVPGKFTHLPAVVSEMYFPENFGRTAGGYFEVK